MLRGTTVHSTEVDICAEGDNCPKETIVLRGTIVGSIMAVLWCCMLLLNLAFRYLHLFVPIVMYCRC